MWIPRALFASVAAILGMTSSVALAQGHAQAQASADTPEERDPDYVRAAVELGLLLTGGTLWYLADDEHDAIHWDRDSWALRFDERAYRYDNNEFHINFVGHAVSGTAYYALSRANELGPFVSFASASLASWVWEFFLEFGNRVSLNDTLLTPVAGMAIGEFVHKLAVYFNSAPGGGATKHRALQWTLGAPVAVHNRLDGQRPPPEDAAADARGFGRGIHARFQMSYGPALARPGAGVDFVTHELRLEGTLAAVAGYLRPGTFERALLQADVTSLDFRASASSEGTDVELDVDTLLLGVHRQSLSEGRHGLVGGAMTLGTSIGYLFRRTSFDTFTDRLGIVGLPGLALDGHLFAGPVSLHFGARVRGEFAGVRSSRFATWADANPEETSKSPLHDHDYFFGWGGSARARAELRMPYVRLGASMRYGTWDSDEGLDRNQSGVTVDVRATERALDYEAWLRVVPFDIGLFAEASVRGQWRRSRVQSLEATRRLERYRVSIGLER